MHDAYRCSARAFSSAGRAAGLHPAGRRFEPVRAHKICVTQKPLSVRGLCVGRGANRQVRKRSASQNMLMVKHENGVFFDLEISTLSRLSYRSTAGSENRVFPYLAVDLSLCKKFALTTFKAFRSACSIKLPAHAQRVCPPSLTTPNIPDRSVYTLHKIPKVIPTSARNLRKMPSAPAR